jgi:TPR repeat protein
MMDDGRGVAQSDAQALKWYRLAADQGYGNAQYNLALMYGISRPFIAVYRTPRRWRA